MSIGQEIIDSLQNAVQIEQHKTIENYIRERFELAGIEEPALRQLTDLVGALYFSGAITDLDQLCDSIICTLLTQKATTITEIEKERKYLGKWQLCEKCVYEITCDKTKPEECKDFRRDPPDGGYYG